MKKVTSFFLPLNHTSVCLMNKERWRALLLIGVELISAHLYPGCTNKTLHPFSSNILSDIIFYNLKLYEHYRYRHTILNITLHMLLYVQWVCCVTLLCVQYNYSISGFMSSGYHLCGILHVSFWVSSASSSFLSKTSQQFKASNFSWEWLCLYILHTFVNSTLSDPDITVKAWTFNF